MTVTLPAISIILLYYCIKVSIRYLKNFILIHTKVYIIRSHGYYYLTEKFIFVIKRREWYKLDYLQDLVYHKYGYNKKIHYFNFKPNRKIVLSPVDDYEDISYELNFKHESQGNP